MCGGKWVWGLFFILLGSLWIAGNLKMIPFDLGTWWPIIFVFVGLSIIFSRSESPCFKMKKMDLGEADWDEFGKGMEKFGEHMEKAFGKKKKKRK
jgi:hypothetical protein